MTSAMRRRLESYWAGRMGCAVEQVRAPGLAVVAPLRENALYIARLGASVVACAADPWADVLARFEPSDLVTQATLARVLPATSRTVGPAFVGYAETVSEPAVRVESCASARDAAFAPLREAVSETEWEHAGLEHHVEPLFAVLTEGRAVAAAGFAILGGEVAHIGVLTDPGRRGEGLGRSVVAAAARAALSSSLIPQYQTLWSNTPAIGIARRLGFEHFVTTIAVHLPQT